MAKKFEPPPNNCRISFVKATAEQMSAQQTIKHVFRRGDGTEVVLITVLHDGSLDIYELGYRAREEALRPFTGEALQMPASEETMNLVNIVAGLRATTPLSVSVIVIPDRRTKEGLLIKSTSSVWSAIVQRLSKDWTLAYTIPPDKWEEIVAGAYQQAGFDEVTLTPRSADLGRDVIAIKRGVGCIKVLGSVKAYKPSHLVKHDDVRALLGVLTGEANASKGVITTTSDFAPRIVSDPFIKPFLPTRLELMNGAELQKWLSDLAAD